MGYQPATQTKTATATLQRNPVPLPKSPAASRTSLHPLLRLQQQVGNQAVSQMIQAKLSVGKPNDTYEQEADRVADSVMRMPDLPVQRQAEEEQAQPKPMAEQGASLAQRQADEKEETAQTKPLIGSITPLVQRQTEEKEEQAQMLQRAEEKEEPVQMLQRAEEKEEQAQMLQRAEEKEEPAQAKEEPGQTPAVTANLENRIQSMRSGGQPLPDSTRSFFETRFGYDFSGVRIHTDSQADEVSRQLNAQAFTIRQNVFFSAGRYEPHTTQGKWLLAHELTHTVQQQSPKPLAASPPAVQSYRNAPSPGHSSLRLRRKGAISISANPVGTIVRKVGGKKSPASPAQDPAFKAVVARSQKVAKQQKKHPPAKTKAAEAQAAAKRPANEVASKAAGNQVQQMEQQQPKPFDRAAFKRALLTKIAAAAPKTLEEADEFKQDGKLTTVKGELTGQVDTGKKQSQGNIETKVKQPPSTSGIEAKQVTPLPPTEKGAPPAKVDAKQAAPKPKTADEISLQEGSQSLEQKMADADVSEDQLKKSNEPDFQGAVEAKNEAQTHASTAPQEYRQSEQGILTQAQSQAQATTQTQLTAMHGTRGQLLNQVMGSQRQGQSKDEQERARVANEIQAIYNRTKQKAEERLNRLDSEVNQVFDSGANAAQQTFEDYVERRMRAYKRQRYDRIGGSVLWAKDKLLGMPDEVNAFYQEGRALYLKLMDAVLDKVAATVEKGLNEAKAEIAKGKKEVEDYVKKQPANLQNVAKEAASNIQSQFDQLEQSVNDKQNQLIDSLAQKYNEKLQEIDARIDEMKAANRGLVDKAMDAIAGVIKTILELKNMLMGLLAKAADAIGKIIKDPIGFLGNLVAGVKQGFLNFMDNIGTHLQKGLMGWLFGAIAESGIQLPDSFDLKGILSLVMQILGMTWTFIRARAVKILGEPVVKVLETTAEIFQIIITKGAAGLWEYIKDQLSSLKDVVIEGIKSFVSESIIKAGITWIIGLLNPAGAFIKACKAIYDIIMFFVERGSQILALVNAVLDSVSAIAGGAIGAAAATVENALAKAVPVVISFLAALLGVTGISSKIREIIARVQAPVGKAIDWVINKAYNLVKSAGKLLGIGKDKNKPDPRTEKQKLADLRAALKEAKTIGDNDSLSLKEVKKRIQSVKEKYQLQELKLVVDKVGKEGTTLHFEGKINPEEKSESVLNKNEVDDERFNKLLYEALKELGQEHYKGFTKGEYATTDLYEKAQAADVRSQRPEPEPKVKGFWEWVRRVLRSILGAIQAKLGVAPRTQVADVRSQKPDLPTRSTEAEGAVKQDERIVEQLRKQKEKEIETLANKIHRELARAQISFSAASMAKYYPNNIFQVGGGKFFVEQANNYYIVPAADVGENYEYYDNKRQPLPRNSQGIPEQASGFKIGSRDRVYTKYPYKKLALQEARDLLKDFPANITDGSVTLVAALLVEPSRYSVAQITNLLILENPDLKGKENVFSKFSMTQGESDPAGGGDIARERKMAGQADLFSKNPKYEQIKQLLDSQKTSMEFTPKEAVDKIKALETQLKGAGAEQGEIDKLRNLYVAIARLKTDPKIAHEGRPKIVTDRDLNAVKENSALLSQLQKALEEQKDADDRQLINSFKQKISNYLKLGQG
ncbi:DUF4157 domain-containing protein [Leptothermofonsia sichuanensis E412]|uniref:eCIS core domain-containing protein n=1 Tax=Leptothermofonsia sichuanensis TaxID=2917832 RepID=UPI001CA781CF|nr:DUF4157 domain-containing protein [Leptothermofonsia sichuanensis]QZZ22010.1 DUF4157 domain-containing protein [Leptothermofonsia sichuanensis E412]